MKRPNLNEEKKLWKKGFKFVVGLDEAGRGPLAGPVTAAAVCIENPKSQIPITNKIINAKSQKRFGHWALEFGFSGIKDSKQLSPKKREEFYEIITTHPSIGWGVGIVSEKVIDKINILEATKLAMGKAIANLNSKFEARNPKSRQNRGLSTRSEQIQNSKLKIQNLDYLLIDGDFRIDIKIPQKSIIKADEKVFSCCVAGIIAKVTRDRLMQKYHKKYPEYNFIQNKGYPTRAHFVSLKRFGPCKIHRRSFRPVKSCVPSANFRKIS